MRLNRVLLLAATISMMMFALVFTISCSGEDGKNGRNGANCTVEPNGDAWDVVCGDETVGILQGTGDSRGEPGPNGQPGAQGPDGSFCWLVGYDIRCGSGNGELKGSLDACTVKEVGTYETEITCKNTKVSLCGDIAFDPAKKYCKLPGTTDDIKNNIGICENGKTYYKNSQYCGLAKDSSTQESPLDFCGYTNVPSQTLMANKINYGRTVTIGSVTYTGAGFFINRNSCETAILSDSTTVNWDDAFTTSADSIAPIQSGSTIPRTTIKGVWVPYPNATTPATQGACYLTKHLVSPGTSSFGTNAIYASYWQGEYCQYTIEYASGSTKPTEKAVISNDSCGEATKATLNKDSWKGEYCGYLKDPKNGNIHSVQTGLCDDYKKPGSKANLGPNQIAYGRGYCTVDIKDRKTGKTSYTEEFCMVTNSTIQDPNKKINEGKWLGQYCGYTSAKSVSNDKVQTGICSDGKGPHEGGFNSGFCEVTFENRDTDSTTFTSLFCGKSGKPNEGSWKGDYCGYKSANSEGPDQVYNAGLCDDGQGPSQNSYSKEEYCQADKDDVTILTTDACDDGAKINEKTWKGEYCGYKDEDASETTKLTGACGDGKGPSSDAFNSGYCRTDRKGKVEYSTAFCGTEGKPNEGEWKGEYCGYASASSSIADKVYTGICDDDRGPNESGFEAGYCQWKEVTSTGTTFAAASELCGTSKVNEGEWKGEYCYSDEKLGVCTGGRIPDTDKKSTDAFTVRCRFPNEFVCSDSNPVACDKDGCNNLGAGFVWNEEGSACNEVAAAPR